MLKRHSLNTLPSLQMDRQENENQIYNYGKRTMFEFMVPEPSRLHRLALTVAKAQVLKAPVDPRKAPEPWLMADPKSATIVQIQHWAPGIRSNFRGIPGSKQTSNSYCFQRSSDK